ncbi:restriction endonuclease subunit S [Priestia aryabhattai]
MKSNYKRLGDYIKKVNVRNTELKVNNLLGINIDKFFMPSVANTVGTDMSKYKIVKNGQFACNRMHVGRDKRLPVTLSRQENDVIVSPAYDVFEVVDKNMLDPEYLMMWFSREEFDRNAWFYTDADIRGGLKWDAFCNMLIPVPPIIKQKEIVREYNVLVDKINLNSRMIQALEETSQSIYKQWFIDFEFIHKKDKPYKSNGGEMIFNEVLDKEIPKGWNNGTLNDLVEIIDGDRGANYPSQEDMQEEGFCLFLNAGNVTKSGFNFKETTFISKEKDQSLRKGKLNRNDVVITSRGTVGNAAYYSEAITYNNIRINSGMLILRNDLSVENAIFVYLMLRNTSMKKEIKNYLSGSAQPQLPIKDLIKIPVLIPSKDVLLAFEKIVKKLQIQIDTINIQNIKLDKLKSIFLSKISMMENSL